MKKVLFILSLVAASFGTQAQSTEGGDFKPAAGNVTLEANFAPFNDSPFSMGYIKGRYFIADQTAARLGFGLSVNTSKPSENFSSRTINFALAPGLEKHFTGTDRLSPYLGAELLLMNRSDRGEGTNTEGGTKYTTVVKNKDGFFSFGLGAVAGADFYVTKHIYLGLELGYGFAFNNEKDTVTETTPSFPGSNRTDENGSSFSLEPSINSSLRIGFVLF